MLQQWHKIWHVKWNYTKFIIKKKQKRKNLYLHLYVRSAIWLADSLHSQQINKAFLLAQVWVKCMKSTSSLKGHSLEKFQSGSWIPKSQKGDVVLWLHPAPLGVVGQQTGVLLAGPKLFLSWGVLTWRIFPLCLLLIFGRGEKLLHRHLSSDPAGPEQSSCNGFCISFDVGTDRAVIWCRWVTTGQTAVACVGWILSGCAVCGRSTFRTRAFCCSMEVWLSFRELVIIFSFLAGGVSWIRTLSVEVEEELLSMHLRPEIQYAVVPAFLNWALCSSNFGSMLNIIQTFGSWSVLYWLSEKKTSIHLHETACLAFC